MTTARIREIADSLKFLAREVDGFAETVEKDEKAVTLQVDAGDQLVKALEDVSGWLEKCRRAHTAMKLPKRLDNRTKSPEGEVADDA